MVQIFSQTVSVAVFCGYIIQREMQNARECSVFAGAVRGRRAMGSLAVVLLVLVPARISRIWVGLDDNDTKSDHWRGSGKRNIETEKEDWDWRIVYAS